MSQQDGWLCEDADKQALNYGIHLLQRMQCVIMDWTEHLERNSEGPKPAEMAGKNHKLKHI